MNLDFSNDQKLLQDEASKFLIKEEALKANRAVMETKSNYDPCLLYTSDAADDC